MRFLRPITAAVISLLAISTPTSAIADRAGVEDPADTDGSFDIASVKERHGRVGERRRPGFVYTLRTYDDWESSTLESEENWIGFLFDPNEKGDFQRMRFLWIRYSQDGLIAEMYKTGAAHPAGELLRTVRIVRPNQYSIRVRFPKRLLRRRGLKSYRWRVESSFEDSGTEECPQGPVESFPLGSCIDSVPNSGWVTHRLQPQT